ncbi:MAG: SDR family NAD(P)-dependent oxidoreductase, partial [Planctomycetota bacterium]
MDFKGKTALVTGAVGAIGKGVAEGFARGGAKVFISDLAQDAVDGAVEELKGAGADCAGLAANVTDEEGVKKVVAAASDFCGGKIDILVNVAGIIGEGKIEELTEEQWDRMFA